MDIQRVSNSLFLIWIALTMQDDSARKRGNGKAPEFASFEIHKSMIELWNINKLTVAPTKTEVGKLQTRVAQ